MAEIVNLRLARKRKKRMAEEAVAVENRIRFGIRAADRELRKAMAEKARRDLEGLRIEPERER
jgi:Domain of unknown function (DUF4169)